MTLAEFLLARIAEDEQDARMPDEGWVDLAEELPLGCWDHRRVLAECDAKRRIVERYENTIFEHWAEPDGEYRNYILPLLALPYATHPDYQEDWKP